MHVQTLIIPQQHVVPIWCYPICVLKIFVFSTITGRKKHYENNQNKSNDLNMEIISTISDSNSTIYISEADYGSGVLLMSISAAVIITVLMVVICLGNVLVIMAFARNRSLRSGNNYFILQLAIADLLVGLSMPVQFLSWVYPDSMAWPHLCIMRYSISFLSMAASIFALLCLTIDRAIALSWPLTYSSRLTRRRVILGAMFIWCPAGLGGMLVQLYHQPVPGNWYEDPYNECEMLKVIRPVVLIHMVSNIFYAVTFINVVIYTRILRLAWKHSRVMADQRKSQGHNQKKVEFKAARTAAVVLGTFYFCWLPLIMTTVVQYYLRLEGNTSLMTFRTFASFLAILNSGMNHIIYTFRMAEMKQEFRKILCVTSSTVSPFAT